jgi:hypothetical protein
MKKITYLFAFIIVNTAVFAQQKLRDGIYVVDQPVNSRAAVYRSNTAAIQFNPCFAPGNPEDYEPLIIITDDYVSFELAHQPVIQNQKGLDKRLLVQLTAAATEKLKTFINKNLLKNIVVVVNGEALAVYKAIQPVNNGLIAITKCNGGACKQIAKALTKTIRL